MKAEYRARRPPAARLPLPRVHKQQIESLGKRCIVIDLEDDEGELTTEESSRRKQSKCPLQLKPQQTVIDAEVQSLQSNRRLCTKPTQQKIRRNKGRLRDAPEKIGYKARIKQQQEQIALLDMLLAKQQPGTEPMETPYTTLMLTFDRSKREHLKNYCYQGNLIAKINRKYELLAFNEEVDPRLKVRYEVQALSGFADNFLIIGLLEREAEDYTSEEERRVVSRGFRPLRGDFVGVYVDGPGRRIQFQVNHFVVQEVEITPELCRLEFIPYLMIYKPGDVLKINYSLEDQFND